jgi:hypothetical protein
MTAAGNWLFPGQPSFMEADPSSFVTSTEARCGFLSNERQYRANLPSRAERDHQSITNNALRTRETQHNALVMIPAVSPFPLPAASWPRAMPSCWPLARQPPPPTLRPAETGRPAPAVRPAAAAPTAVHAHAAAAHRPSPPHAEPQPAPAAAPSPSPPHFLPPQQVHRWAPPPAHQTTLSRQAESTRLSFVCDPVHQGDCQRDHHLQRPRLPARMHQSRHHIARVPHQRLVLH